MSTTVEYDLREIFNKFEAKLDKLEIKLDKLTEDVNDIKVTLTKTSTELKGDLNALNEKVDRVESTLGEKISGIDTRLSNQEFLNRAVVIGFGLALLAGIAKLFGLIPS